MCELLKVRESWLERASHRAETPDKSLNEDYEIERPLTLRWKEDSERIWSKLRMRPCGVSVASCKEVWI